MYSSDRLSVIICSIDPDKCNGCIDALKRTAGITLDIHVTDNRADARPIAEVYNDSANISGSPYLLFIHEDVIISSHGWGRKLLDKLSEPETGVIGFAGSTLRVPVPGGWDQGGPEYMRASLRHIEHGEERTMSFGVVDGETFRQVIAVDGLAMAVRRDVWARHPFDEAMLTGFHCYDIDFSLTISMAGYRNYAYTFGIIHFSRGSYEEQWLATTYKMLVEKWSPKLPYGVDGSLKDIDVDGLSASLDYDHIFRFFRKGISKSLARKMVHRYLRKCRHSRAYRSHMAVVCWRYLCKYAFKK